MSLSFPHTEIAENPSANTPISMPVPEAIPILSEVSTSNLPEDADQQMKTRLDDLRQPAVEETPEKAQKDAQFSFDMPTSTWVEAQGHRKPYPGAPVTIPTTYPGLDGHPRRITPIPISRAQEQSSTTAV